jgi:hypothetical protein
MYLPFQRAESPDDISGLDAWAMTNLHAVSGDYFPNSSTASNIATIFSGGTSGRML